MRARTVRDDLEADPGNWGVTGDNTGRVVWARLTW